VTALSERARATPEALAATLDTLRDRLGADRVCTGADDLAQHGRDESFHPLAVPDAVVWPRSVPEAAAIVGACAAHRVAIVPFGAGTSLEGHSSALAGGISIDMRELDQIGRPSLEDLDVVVGAGVTRRALDARLRPEGVFFSVDPGADATIGGMVATGASGTTTVRYGAMRENVLSLVVIDGHGRIVHTHSRARKSSAGDDLTRLMIGSEGTLGLICEATLRLHPTPEATAAAQCTFDSMKAAVDAVVRVSQHAIPVVRIELADELQLEAINRHFLDVDDDRADAAVRVSGGIGGRGRRPGAGDRADLPRIRGRGLSVGCRRGRAPADVARPPRRDGGDACAASGGGGTHHRRVRPDLGARGVRGGDPGRHRGLEARRVDRRPRRGRELPRDPGIRPRPALP
jgi:FAD/FMN-containing dehydrogenase